MSNIFAVSSGQGKAGVSVIRISGDQAFESLANLGVNSGGVKNRIATLKTFKNPASQEVIDKALILKFESPNSFTGEDTIELHCHGSIAVVKNIIQILSSIPNFRMAEAGEFSKRSFENGKMDLVQAEGLADLIEAETSAQAKQALKQLEGENSAIYEDWRNRVIEIMAFIEAYVDFPDEDIPQNLDLQAVSKISDLRQEIEAKILDKRGQKLRDGAICTIIGKANAGKSTLINFLSQREIAIVSDIAGTTRDSLESHLDIDGYPLTLIDTAGIRESEDIIEQKGVQIALEKAKRADILILIIDAEDIENNAENIQEFESILNENSIVIINKIDNSQDEYISELAKHIHQKTNITPIKVSLSKKVNSEVIFSQIREKLSLIMDSTESSLITRERHKQNLNSACEFLEEFEKSLDNNLPIELRAEILRKASYQIGKVIGKVDVEDILDKIFSEFCIGK